MQMSTNKIEWFKSSYSGQNGDCVEARFLPNSVDCRDSKDPSAAALSFEPGAWGAFVANLKADPAPGV